MIEGLVKATLFYRRYYESVRSNTQRVRDLEPDFRAIFRRLHDRVDGATFPDVTFVIGRLNAAGTSTADGLVIGAEQACRAADSALDEMPPRQRQILSRFDDLPHLVAHELAQRALRDLLDVKDATAFLAASGYRPR